MFNKTEIEKYFLAEKQESLVFIIIGVIAIILALIFYFSLKSNVYKGAAIPLIVVGIIQVSVGFIIYKRSDPDRIRNVYAYDMNPGELQQKEIPRMEKVNKSFVIYKWIEIILLVSAIAMIFVYRSKPEKSFLFGLAIALAIQSLVMLAADYIAEKRAHTYMEGLKSIFDKKN